MARSPTMCPSLSSKFAKLAVLKIAKCLLADSEKPLEKIAAACEVGPVDTLQRTFRQETGTDSVFRRRTCLCCTDRPEITARRGNRSCAVSAVDCLECSRSGRMPELGEHLLREQVLICRFSRAESIRIMQLRWACSSAGRASALQEA